MTAPIGPPSLFAAGIAAVDQAATMALLKDRLAEVERRLVTACERVGRTRADVTLVAVTKTVSVEVAALLPELGVFDLGENRPQELWRKASALPKAIRWHLIGHLQRNKIAATLPLVRLVHSVDSARLLQAIEQEAAKQERSVNALLEVNTSGETTKHGFAPRDLPTLIPILEGLKHVEVRGLMTMAALQEAEKCRPTFAKLRQLAGDPFFSLVDPAQHLVPQLSMGMSNDFEVAIEEGATLVRLGTVLFEGLKR